MTVFTCAGGVTKYVAHSSTGAGSGLLSPQTKVHVTSVVEKNSDRRVRVFFLTQGTEVLWLKAKNNKSSTCTYGGKPDVS